ncbi:MAG: ATP-binding protein [Candidatus Competibacteraceae bacterium]|nr:ATP-binding protein [Candidatus Competibacteraceae bacterium]
MRFFNTAGPNDSQRHYTLPPLERLDLDEMLMLIDQQKYFVLHAPRQTGKTTCLLALRDHLNGTGSHRSVYTNVEVAQSAREDVAAAMQAILAQLGSWAEGEGDNFVATAWPKVLERHGPHAALGEVLTRWAGADPRPLVLLIDEIDALVGDTLISVLRQLRAGYPRRPRQFPQSVILCGVRDVRDYRIHSSAEKSVITGGSAFNIKAESLRLGDFIEPKVRSLYDQHTQETGQIFEPAALERLWELGQGQPWLTSALGYEVCFKSKAGRNRSRPIGRELVNEAKENLILRRETHLDQLIDKLQEERVRRVIEPLLVGSEEAERIPGDDLQYVQDLGLIKIDRQVYISNPIYQEVIPRELVYSETVTLTQPTSWYLRTDGTLDLSRLLGAFQQFFREHSEHWVERFQYKEAGPQLLLQAFLQRVVNGGGRIEREYGLGRMRTDLLVLWPYEGGVQKEVIELKLLHRSLKQTLATGLEQTWQYLDRCGAGEGHLVIFDRTPGKPWEEKLFCRSETLRGRTLTVWGM